MSHIKSTTQIQLYAMLIGDVSPQHQIYMNRYNDNPHTQEARYITDESISSTSYCAQWGSQQAPLLLTCPSFAAHLPFPFHILWTLFCGNSLRTLFADTFCKATIRIGRQIQFLRIWVIEVVFAFWVILCKNTEKNIKYFFLNFDQKSPKFLIFQ